MKAFLILASILVLTVYAQDTQTLLAQAQRDYIRGDRAAAKEKFTLVSKAEPNNRVAVSYLRRIAAEEKNKGVDEAAALRTRLDKTVIEKIELKDVAVSDALDFLGKKIATASPSASKVNIVLQLTEEEKNTRITLSLSKVPASEALRYITSLTNLSADYEKFAVVVRSKQAAK